MAKIETSAVGTRETVENPFSSRIIGGSDVVVTKQDGTSPYPFFVEWTQGCGAVLVHSNIILTAGHCYNESVPTLATVYLGGNPQRGRGTPFSIHKLYRHPRFNQTTLEYDFMLLTLEERTTFVSAVINRDPLYPLEGMELAVLGFGALYEGDRNGSSILQQATVQYYGPQRCDALLQSSGTPNPGINVDDIDFDVLLCAGNAQGGSDSCTGDSGGPLLDANNTLVGIVSYGATACGEPLNPGIYSRVSAVVDWIDQLTCLHSKDPKAIQPHCMEVVIHIQYDAYPEEVSFAVINAGMEEIYYSQQEVDLGDVQPHGESKTTIRLPQGSYFILIEDSAGDGLCCNFGRGNVTVSVGDQIYYVHSEFEYEQIALIEVPGKEESVQTPAPTMATPAPVPVAMPTSAPVTTASVPPRPTAESVTQAPFQQSNVVYVTRMPSPDPTPQQTTSSRGMYQYSMASNNDNIGNTPELPDHTKKYSGPGKQNVASVLEMSTSGACSTMTSFAPILYTVAVAMVVLFRCR